MKIGVSLDGYKMLLRNIKGNFACIIDISYSYSKKSFILKTFRSGSVSPGQNKFDSQTLVRHEIVK